MPAAIAASTGIDALCHLLECFTSTVANPVSDNRVGERMHQMRTGMIDSHAAVVRGP
jgi:alcohol dehydrogenase class IV